MKRSVVDQNIAFSLKTIMFAPLLPYSTPGSPELKGWVSPSGCVCSLQAFCLDLVTLRLRGPAPYRGQKTNCLSPLLLYEH